MSHFNHNSKYCLFFILLLTVFIVVSLATTTTNNNQKEKENTQQKKEEEIRRNSFSPPKELIVRKRSLHLFSSTWLKSFFHEWMEKAFNFTTDKLNLRDKTITETDRRIGLIKNEIATLYQLLKLQERTLGRLVEKKEEIKKDNWFWFFDRNLRESISFAQRGIDRQRRKIEGTLADLENQWRRLKPLYGPFSRLFLYELVGAGPWLLLAPLFGILESLLFFDVITWSLLLLLVGPLGAVQTVWPGALGAFLGTVLNSWKTFVSGGAVFLSLYWLIYILPSILLEYDPSFFEFIAVYVPFLVPLGASSLWLYRHFFGGRTTHLQRGGRSVDELEEARKRASRRVSSRKSVELEQKTKIVEPTLTNEEKEKDRPLPQKNEKMA